MNKAKEKIKNMFLVRWRAVKGLFKGRVNFTYLWVVFLPHQLHPKHPKLMFLGHPLTYSLLSDGLGEIEQILIENQYHVELIKGSRSIIDAGSNIGGFSVYAAYRNPDAKVYAFEPTSETFEMLKENTKYYKNITCFNYALGKENKMVEIVRHPNGSPGSNYVGQGGTPIEMKTIDSFKFDDVQFLKMDVEGFEADVLEGAAETIKKSKPIIAMSAYHKPEDVIELPKTLNTITSYDCELRHDLEDLFLCTPTA